MCPLAEPVAWLEAKLWDISLAWQGKRLGLPIWVVRVVCERLICCAGSGRSFTAYVFIRKGFVPPQPAGSRGVVAAAEEAAMQPATPGCSDPRAALASGVVRGSQEAKEGPTLDW
jgi:hypothetical protein